MNVPDAVVDTQNCAVRIGGIDMPREFLIFDDGITVIAGRKGKVNRLRIDFAVAEVTVQDYLSDD